MIVFRCPCNYTYVIDLEAAKVIGPFFISGAAKEFVYIGNQEKEISMGAFRDFYGDCWNQLQSRIVAGNAK